MGANPPQVLLNGSFADMDAQFQEFSAHPLSADLSARFAENFKKFEVPENIRAAEPKAQK